MRRHGNLTRWNEDRGFGFITPAGSDTELFVHISAFPRGGSRPEQGELLSFETEKGPDGRDRAVRIYRAGQAPTRARAPAASREPASGSYRALGSMALVLVVAGIWAVAVWQRADPTAPKATVLPAPVKATQELPPFECDGRTRCPQMRSCAEAKFFIRNCPGTEMDGDHDGLPCESQHCAS